MKKTRPDFPWYMIYTPIIAVIIAMWYWDTQSGEASMGIFEKILNWLGVNDQTAANLVIICIAILALLYIVVRWFSTSDRLKNIEKVANTAPTDITEHIDAANSKICDAIQTDKTALVKDISAINANTGNMAQQLNAIMTQRADLPVQQSQIIAEIASLYNAHDESQKTISSLKKRVFNLEKKVVQLTGQLEKAEQELQEYRRDSSRDDYDLEP